jgi:hypothetical protein
MRQFQINFSPEIQAARKLGTEASEKARSKAEEVCPGFSALALDFIACYARENERFSGEVLTYAMKFAGIQPGEDRAFGPIYAKAIRLKLIKVIGYVPRVRGHGTSGGKLYTAGDFINSTR